MSKETIRFALAVNHAGDFQEKQFGDADKYIIYEWKNDELTYVKEEINVYKSIDEELEHGSHRKGRTILNFLKSMDVNVLLSRQFGKNIQLVNNHFIPVIIYTETTDEVIPVIEKHIKWIEDEFNNQPEEYRLFVLENGALKISIKSSGFY